MVWEIISDYSYDYDLYGRRKIQLFLSFAFVKCILRWNK